MLAPNTLIHDRYRIVRHIAGGGMGSVYEATDERLGHTVALKQLALTDASARQAFEREAKTLAPLQNPNLPNVSDYFSDPAGLFLVMSYIPGDDLGEQLAQRGQPFPVEQLLVWTDQLLQVLEYLHKKGIIHRDIKPQNLKLTDEGRIILLDFGIAKSSTKSSVMAATPDFAPLEQMQGQGTDVRSDLYALAATMYCLLTGKHPERSIDRWVAESRQQPDPIRPLHTINPQVSPAVSDVLMRAMALHADNRPASAAAMRQMLQAARAPQSLPPTVPVSPPSPAPSPVQPVPGKGRTTRLFQVIGVVLLILTVLLIVPGLLSSDDTVSLTAPSVTAMVEAETARPIVSAMTTEPSPIPTTAPLPPPTATPLPAWVPTMAEIPAGPFLMGSSYSETLADNDEKPQHELTLDTYWLGKTEVTNAQFRPFVEGDGYTNPDYWTNAGWEWRQAEGIDKPCRWNDAEWNSAEQPVVCVSWYEAVAYTRWLSEQTGHPFRLPTEAEWEKAARGPEGLIWPWGNEWLAGHANGEAAGIDKTMPVGSYPDGASYYGVLDMAGNAWEWTTTKWMKDYPYVLEDEWNTAYLESDAERAIRSCSFKCSWEFVRGADRHSNGYPHLRRDSGGLRVASDSPPPGGEE
jgi:formylglycine-generating enzyme required for sulfatase activity